MGTIEEDDVSREASDCEEKVLVLVRVRPLNEKEILRNDVSDWECINDNTIIFRNTLSVSERSMYPTAYVFACIFAYGQTSSGKTYTMTGITEYAIADIYNHVERYKEREFILKFSAIEIYNESVKDFLNVDGAPLRLLDDPERGTVVEKLTEETLKDRRHLHDLLSICEAQRQIGETSLNETSSRSHQIFRLTIESSSRELLGNGSSNTLTASVNFVDLAGSERASQSLSAGTRLKEGCHINRSLLTLGTVIRKLSKGRNGHIPFRDSKLTRILQSSLGANAKTCIICTMSPARSHVEQSRNTLLFGSCAKDVATNAQVNIVVSDKVLVKHLQRELSRLESELRSFSPNLNPNPNPNPTASSSATLLRDKEYQIKMLQEEISDLSLERDTAQSHVEELQQLLENIRSSNTLVVGSDQGRPKLQIEKAWKCENALPEPYLDCRVDKSYTTVYSSEHNGSFLDENYPQIPIHNAKADRVDSYRNDKGSFGNSEDFCKEVQCIEIKNSTMTAHASNTSSYEENEGGMVKYNIGNLELVASPVIREDMRVFSCISQESTSKAPTKSQFSAPSLQLTRSRSSNAYLRSSFRLPWLENLENGHTRPDEFEKDFGGRTKGFQIKLPPLNYDAKGMESLWIDDSETSVRSTSSNEHESQNVSIYTEVWKKTNESSVSISGSDDVIEIQFPKQPINGMVNEAEINGSFPRKDVKSIGLDPIQCNVGSPAWPAEFKRLEREIIKLWHECNVSLIHRTFFFLTFKGDPADSVYMKVELRRLYVLSNLISQGTQIVENGQSFTPGSRTKALSRERDMLRSRMKKLGGEDRKRLYLKWGIGFKTKQRKFQVICRIWTDPEDMDHVKESALLVARLSGYKEEPVQALKDVFGLNFTPHKKTRFSGCRGSVR